MNVNKGDIVYAIYYYGNEALNYRKERFIRYQNRCPVCTVDMNDGISMGYDCIFLNEKDALNYVNKFNKRQNKNGYITRL